MFAKENRLERMVIIFQRQQEIGQIKLETFKI